MKIFSIFILFLSHKVTEFEWKIAPVNTLMIWYRQASDHNKSCVLREFCSLKMK